MWPIWALSSFNAIAKDEPDLYRCWQYVFYVRLVSPFILNISVTTNMMIRLPSPIIIQVYSLVSHKPVPVLSYGRRSTVGPEYSGN